MGQITHTGVDKVVADEVEIRNPRYLNLKQVQWLEHTVPDQRFGGGQGQHPGAHGSQLLQDGRRCVGLDGVTQGGPCGGRGTQIKCDHGTSNRRRRYAITCTINSTALTVHLRGILAPAPSVHGVDCAPARHACTCIISSQMCNQLHHQFHRMDCAPAWHTGTSTPAICLHCLVSINSLQNSLTHTSPVFWDYVVRSRVQLAAKFG